jgi:uncharacterized protein YraI
VIVDSRIEGNFATLGNDIYNADQAEIATDETAGVFIDTCPVIVREALDRIDCADGAEVCLSSGEAISRAAFRPDELALLDRSTGEWGVALVQSGPLVVFGDPGADAYPPLIGRTALTNSLNDTLNIRANPGLNEPILVELEHGSEVTLIGEPQQTDDLDWWRVDYGEGEGWVVDKVGDFRTLLLNTPDTLTVGRTVAIFADLLNLRASPGTDDAVVRVSQRGVDMVILDGPVENDGFTWWHVRNTFGYEGWAAEFADGEPTFLPVVNAAPVGDFHIFSFPDGLDAPNCWPLNELPGP